MHTKVYNYCTSTNTIGYDKNRTTEFGIGGKTKGQRTGRVREDKSQTMLVRGNTIEKKKKLMYM